jgi:hypothetical protein
VFNVCLFLKHANSLHLYMHYCVIKSRRKQKLKMLARIRQYLPNIKKVNRFLESDIESARLHTTYLYTYLYSVLYAGALKNFNVSIMKIKKGKFFIIFKHNINTYFHMKIQYITNYLLYILTFLKFKLNILKEILSERCHKRKNLL